MRLQAKWTILFSSYPVLCSACISDDDAVEAIRDPNTGEPVTVASDPDPTPDPTSPLERSQSPEPSPTPGPTATSQPTSTPELAATLELTPTPEPTPTPPEGETKTECGTNLDIREVGKNVGVYYEGEVLMVKESESGTVLQLQIQYSGGNQYD